MKTVRTNEEIRQTCAEACEILIATHDGDELNAVHLALLEHGVNGFLKPAGKDAFRALLANVRAGYDPNGEPRLPEDPQEAK